MKVKFYLILIVFYSICFNTFGQLGLTAEMGFAINKNTNITEYGTSNIKITPSSKVLCSINFRKNNYYFEVFGFYNGFESTFQANTKEVTFEEFGFSLGAIKTVKAYTFLVSIGSHLRKFDNSESISFQDGIRYGINGRIAYFIEIEKGLKVGSSIRTFQDFGTNQTDINQLFLNQTSLSLNLHVNLKELIEKLKNN